MDYITGNMVVTIVGSDTYDMILKGFWKLFICTYSQKLMSEYILTSISKIDIANDSQIAHICDN